MKKVLIILLLMPVMVQAQNLRITSGGRVVTFNNQMAVTPAPSATPLRSLTTRTSLDLIDEIGTADATLGSFPLFRQMAIAPTTGVQRYYDQDDTIKSDFTYINLIKRNQNVTETRATAFAPDYNYSYTAYLRASQTSIYTNIGAYSPSVNWDEVQLFGWIYDSTANQISALWNDIGPTVARTQGVRVADLRQSFATNFGDYYPLGVYGFKQQLTEDELDSIRISGKFPEYDPFIIAPWQNIADTTERWYDWNGVSGMNSYWETTGAFNRPSYPDSVWTRTHDKAAAYSTFNGFTRRGATVLPYSPSGLKGDSVLIEDVEHPATGVIWNLSEAMFDGNPLNEPMSLSESDMIYTIFDKSNRTIWDSKIEDYKNGVYYMQNDSGNYTLWHWKELLNYEKFINPAYEKRLAIEFRRTGGIVTGIERVSVFESGLSDAQWNLIRSDYSMDITRPKAYLFFVVGNTFANGLHTAWYLGHMPTKDSLYYIGTVGDNDSIGRFDGRTMTQGGTPEDPSGDTYRFRDFNPLYNYRGAYSVTDQSIGNEHIAIIDLLRSGHYSDGKVFAHAFTLINSHLIDDNGGTNGIDFVDTLNWSGLKSQNCVDASIRNFQYGIDYLEGMGYNVEVIGINTAISPYWGTDYDPSVYKDHYTAMIDKYRRYFDDYNEDTIPVIALRMDTLYYRNLTSYASDSFNIMIDELESASDYFRAYNYEGMPRSALVYDMRTITQVLQGKYLSGQIISIDQNLSAPTLSNVNVSGTIQINQPITASYTWGSVVSEGNSEIIVQGADDIFGTGSTFLNNHVTGDSYTIAPTWANKYIRVGVMAKDVNSVTSNVYFSDWELVSP